MITTSGLNRADREPTARTRVSTHLVATSFAPMQNAARAASTGRLELVVLERPVAPCDTVDACG
jgi:hypothetical protein